MKGFNKAWNILIALLVPIVAICLSINLVARMPDVYQYSFKSTEQLKSAALTVGSDEFGDLLSGYMIGKHVDLRVAQGDDPNQKYDFFTDEDIEILKNVRFKLNIVLIFGVLAFMALIFAFVACKDIDDGAVSDRAIKHAKVSSLIIFFVMIIFFSVNLVLNFPIWENGILKYGSENLHLVITLKLLQYLYIAWMITAGIFEVIILYVANKLTKPKRMFSRGNY